VHLVWVYSDPSDAAYEAEVRAETLNNPFFTFTHWNSRSMGRIDAKKLAELLGGSDELKRCSVFICGPPALMRSMFDQLVDAGLSPRRIFYEDFELLG
jgi:ferredoxin-NADP reductase